MTVRDVAAQLGAEILSEGDLSRTVCGGYAGDLLSWVMGNVEADHIWITIMTNANVVAVALLRDVSAVLLSEGVEMEAEVLDKARQEKITVLRCAQSTYALCAALDRLLCGTLADVERVCKAEDTAGACEAGETIKPVEVIRATGEIESTGKIGTSAMQETTAEAACPADKNTPGRKAPAVSVNGDTVIS